MDDWKFNLAVMLSFVIMIVDFSTDISAVYEFGQLLGDYDYVAQVMTIENSLGSEMGSISVSEGESLVGSVEQAINLSGLPELSVEYDLLSAFDKEYVYCDIEAIRSNPQGLSEEITRIYTASCVFVAISFAALFSGCCFLCCRAARGRCTPHEDTLNFVVRSVIQVYTVGPQLAIVWLMISQVGSTDGLSCQKRYYDCTVSGDCTMGDLMVPVPLNSNFALFDMLACDSVLALSVIMGLIDIIWNFLLGTSLFCVVGPSRHLVLPCLMFCLTIMPLLWVKYLDDLIMIVTVCCLLCAVVLLYFMMCSLDGEQGGMKSGFRGAPSAAVRYLKMNGQRMMLKRKFGSPAKSAPLVKKKPVVKKDTVKSPTPATAGAVTSAGTPMSSPLDKDFVSVAEKYSLPGCRVLEFDVREINGNFRPCAVKHDSERISIPGCCVHEFDVREVNGNYRPCLIENRATNSPCEENAEKYNLPGVNIIDVDVREVNGNYVPCSIKNRPSIISLEKDHVFKSLPGCTVHEFDVREVNGHYVPCRWNSPVDHEFSSKSGFVNIPCPILNRATPELSGCTGTKDEGTCKKEVGASEKVPVSRAGTPIPNEAGRITRAATLNSLCSTPAESLCSPQFKSSLRSPDFCGADYEVFIADADNYKGWTSQKQIYEWSPLPSETNEASPSTNDAFEEAWKQSESASNLVLVSESEHVSEIEP